MTSYNKYNISKFIIFFYLLSSCNRSFEGELINLNADGGRTNSYERLGNFWKLNYFIDKPESKDSSGIIIPPLALTSSELVASTTSGNIIYTSRNKTIWEFQFPDGQVAASGMCADRTQNIYVITNKGILYSFSINGKLRWDFMLIDSMAEQQIYSDLLVVNDGVVCGARNGIITKISFEGKLIWKRISSFMTTLSFATDTKGNLYIPLTQNIFGGTDSLIKLKSNGKLSWGLAFDRVRFDKSPVVMNDKIYIAGIYDLNDNRITKLHSISTKGKILWEKNISIFPRFLSVSKDESIYFIGYNSGFGEYLTGIFSFSANGRLNWKKYFEIAMPAPVIIGKDEIAFIGKSRKSLGIYFLKKSGKIIKTISLSEAPILYLQPTVTPEAVILFGCTESFQFVRIDDTPLNKLLPY